MIVWVKGVDVRKLLVIVIAAATIWGGYWFVGSSAVESGLSSWLSDRQRDGWIAEYSSLHTRGFPNYFDTTITDLELVDPRTGVAWNAPVFKISALSYKPNHIIAMLPKEQTVASPFERITVNNTNMRGSVVFETSTSLALERSNFEIDAFTLTSNRGWKAGVQTGRLATRQTVAISNTHDIYFEASGVTPSASVLSALDPAGLLPKIFDTLTIDTTIGFDAPWDRFAIERSRPQIVSLDLKKLQATWGDLDLRAAGELEVDGAGIPTGSITIKAVNWREMLNIAVSAGILPKNVVPTAERAMELLAGMSGSPKTLDAPLSFQNGRIWFGPVPLGPVPRLVIR